MRGTPGRAPSRTTTTTEATSTDAPNHYSECDGRLGTTIAKTIAGPTHQIISACDGRLGATMAKTIAGPTHQTIIAHVMAVSEQRLRIHIHTWHASCNTPRKRCWPGRYAHGEGAHGTLCDPGGLLTEPFTNHAKPLAHVMAVSGQRLRRPLQAQRIKPHQTISASISIRAMQVTTNRASGACPVRIWSRQRLLRDGAVVARR